MQQRINLVPQKPLAERIKNLIPIIFVTMAGLLIVIFLGWQQLLNIRLADQDETIQRLESQASQASELTSRVAALKKDVQQKNLAIDQKRAEIAKLSKISGQKKKFSQPLSLIASLLPDSIRCRRISFTGAMGELQGTALDYDDLVWLVRRLQELHIFTKVALSVTDRTTDQQQERIEFTINLHLA